MLPGVAATPTPTPVPPPSGPPLHPSLAGYSTLFASVMWTLPAQYDFVSDGLTAGEKEVMDWADSRLFSNDDFLDSLDRVLDGLGIYEGVCVSCYGKTGYDTVELVNTSYHSIVYNQQHVHREMLKTFPYFAKADGKGILVGA